MSIRICGDPDKHNRTTNCIKCGTDLHLGKFAYNQEMCWECFEAIAIIIAISAKTNDEQKMVLYMLDVMRETYDMRRGKSLSKNSKTEQK